MRNITETFYLIIEPKDPERLHMGLRSPRMTKSKPALKKREIALRLQLEIPTSLFTEFIPSGKLTLPEDLNLGRPEIDIEVPEDVLVRPGVRLKLVSYEEDG